MPGPLDGVKVVDLSQVVAGPFAAMLMADQGAEVVKVEPTAGLGDLTRLPSFDKGGLGAFYLNNNRGKRCLSLDLSQQAAQQIVLDLCRDSDVFIENFRPGATARLGLGYDAVKEVNPDIVYLSINGFGSTGPYSKRPVLDPVIQGLCGIIDRQVNPQIPFPDMVRNLYCDKSTAMQAAQAVTAALYAREKGAGGQFIEIPMIDAGMYMFWPDGMMDMTMMDDDANGGIRLATVYNLTECSDGKIVYFAASDAQRNGVSIALGHPEWAEDERFNSMTALAANPENFVLLGEMLTEAFAQLTCDEALASLIEADVPCGPVLTAEEAVVNEQIEHNGTLVQWQHPTAGTVRQPKPAARFSKTPAEVAASASLRGEDNDAILRELGRSDDDIAALRDSGAIG